MYESSNMKNLDGESDGSFTTLSATVADVGTLSADTGDISILSAGSATVTGVVSANSITNSTDITTGTTAANSDNEILIKNTSTGNSATAQIRFETNTAQTVLKKTGTNYAGTEGAESLTLKNDGTGDVRIFRSGDIGVKLRSTDAFFNQPIVMDASYAIFGSSAVDGVQQVVVQNPSTGLNAVTSFYLDNTSGNYGILFKNGPNKSSDGGTNTMTLRNELGNLRLQTGVQGITIASGAVTCDVSLTSPIVYSSGTLTVDGASTLTGAVTLGSTLAASNTFSTSGLVTSTNTTDANSALNGAINTSGGIKASKTIVANQGFQLPYGQAIKSDEYSVIQTKMMMADFNRTGGVTGDGLYLFTPGSTGGSASTDFVLGINESEAKFPQDVTVAGNLTVTGTVTGGSIVYASTSTGTMSVTNLTGTTFTVLSTDPLSATFAGGVDITGDLNVGGVLTAGTISYASTSTGTLDVTNVSGTTLTVASTKDSTSATDAAVEIAGGLGVLKKFHCGEEVHVGQGYPTNNNRNVRIYNTSTGANAVAEYILSNNDGNARVSLYSSGTATPNALRVQNNVGPVHIYNTGGSGIEMDTSIVLELPTRVTDTTESTSTSTGAQIIDGGLGVAKNANFGQSMIVGSSTNGGRSITITNTNAGTSAQTLLYFDTDGANNAVLFKNGSGYLGGDGAARSFTIRNDDGAVRLLNNGGMGFTISSSNIDAVGNLNFRTSVANGTSYLDPAYILNNPTTPVGTGVTQLFLQSALTEGKDAVLAIGNSLGTRQSAVLTYKYHANDADKEINLGFYGVGLGITLKNSTMSIAGGPFFSYTEGSTSWDANPPPDPADADPIYTDGLITKIYNNSYIQWKRIGNVVHVNFYVKFDMAGMTYFGLKAMFPIAITNTNTVYPTIMLSTEQCDLSGFSKPYYAVYDPTSSTNAGEPIMIIIGFNNSRYSSSTGNGSATGNVLAGQYSYICA